MKNAPGKPWLAEATVEYSEHHNYSLGASIDKKRKLQLIRTPGLNHDMNKDHLWAEVTDKDLWCHAAFPVDLIRQFDEDHAEPFTAQSKSFLTIKSYEYHFLEPITHDPVSNTFQTLSRRLVLLIREFEPYGFSGDGEVTCYHPKGPKDWRQIKQHGHAKLASWIDRVEARHRTVENAMRSNSSQLNKASETAPEVYPSPGSKTKLPIKKPAEKVVSVVGNEQAAAVGISRRVDWSAEQYTAEAKLPNQRSAEKQSPVVGIQRMVDWKTQRYRAPRQWKLREAKLTEAHTVVASSVIALAEAPVVSTSNSAISSIPATEVSCTRSGPAPSAQRPSGAVPSSSQGSAIAPSNLTPRPSILIEEEHGLFSGARFSSWSPSVSPPPARRDNCEEEGTPSPEERSLEMAGQRESIPPVSTTSKSKNMAAKERDSRCAEDELSLLKHVEEEKGSLDSIEEEPASGEVLARSFGAIDFKAAARPSLLPTWALRAPKPFRRRQDRILSTTPFSSPPTPSKPLRGAVPTQEDPVPTSSSSSSGDLSNDLPVAPGQVPTATLDRSFAFIEGHDVVTQPSPFQEIRTQMHGEPRAGQGSGAEDFEARLGAGTRSQIRKRRRSSTESSEESLPNRTFDQRYSTKPQIDVSRDASSDALWGYDTDDLSERVCKSNARHPRVPKKVKGQDSA